MKIIKLKYLFFTLITLIGVFMAQTSVNASVFFAEQSKVPECLLKKNEE